MALLRRLLVEPFFRFLYGPPLKDGVPTRPDGPVDESASDPRCEALVITAGGVGGFDLSGTALRYLLAAEGLPYAIHVFPWGHGFGRWFADLTDVPNRDARAAQLVDTVRHFQGWQS